MTRFEDQCGEYVDARTVIVVRCSDGESRILDDALTNVLNYWGGELRRLGIADYAPRQSPDAPGARFMRRDEVANANLALDPRLRWKKTFQFLKFDNTKGRSEPIDLSDNEIRMRFFKPTFSVHVTLEPHDGGAPIDCTLELTSDQHDAFRALNTEVEREKFLWSLIAELQKETAQSSEELPNQMERNPQD